RAHARSADGRRLSGSHARERPHHRQPRETDPAQVRRRRSVVCRDRRGLRRGLPVCRRMTWISRIGLRLLAFNLLVVFVPVAGVLYLGIYESRLRQEQEAGLAQQARVLAAALGDRETLDGEQIAQLFTRLERRSDARFRVYDTAGAVIADSARQM